MAALKTKPTSADPLLFLEAIESHERRQDCLELVKLMEKLTEAHPIMWGDSIVGFGEYQYAGKSGRSGTWFLCGFSPRKQAIAIYSMGGLNRIESFLTDLGKHKTGGSCLYIKRLADVNLPVLTDMLASNIAHIRAAHPD